MATKNLGKVAITPRGEWVDGIYERLDLVSYQGSSYLSKKDGNTSAVTVTADWLKIAAKGNPGGKGDPGNNGWQPQLVPDAVTVPGKTLLKLEDWIGGEGIKPTTNVGKWHTATGGYTSDASQATNIKGESSNNLIVDYVHSSNKEVVIQNYDSTTGIVTAANHGLTNGALVNPMLNKGVNGIHPHTVMLPKHGVSYTVAVIDANTFTLNDGGVVQKLTKPAGIDYTKFHLETPSGGVIFNNINEKSIRIHLNATPIRSNTLLLPYTINGTSYQNQSLSESGLNFGSNGGMSFNPVAVFKQIADLTVHTSVSGVTVIGNLLTTTITDSNTLTTTSSRISAVNLSSFSGLIQELNVGTRFSNGTVIRIYKI